MTIRVQSGFSPDHRARVAQLFWMAFETKLRLPLGPEPKALAFIEEGLNADFAFSATSPEGALLDVAGVRKSKAGCSVAISNPWPRI